MFSGIFLFMGVIVFFMVLMSSVNTLLMAMFERTREIGTMLAMGTPRAWIVALFMLEATLLGVFGAVAGVAAGNLLGALLNASGLHMPPPPGYTVPMPFTVLHVPGLMIGSSYAGHRLAGARIHSSRDPRIPATNCGGTRSCLTINCVLRTFLLLFSSAFFSPACLVATLQPLPPPMPKPCSSAPTLIATAGPRMSCTSRSPTTNPAKPDEEKLYEVSQKGTDKTYVEFLSPREKGQHLLMLGDDMWVYLPDTSRPVRITPLERLSGDASNGDVARTNYAVDYTPVYLRTEKVGAKNATFSNLTAKRKGSTYQRILYWLRVEDARPVRAEFYLTSGKHIKSATFDEYAPIGGKTLLHKLTLYDEIRHNSHSVLEYSGIRTARLPDKLFYQGRTDRF